MPKGNLAYDLSKYENAVAKPSQEEKRKIRIQKARAEAAGSPVKVIVIAIAAGILLGMVIYSKVENASVHAEITELNSQVDMLRSENVRMQTEIESKSALRSVEDYAENILGMQKLDKSQIEYLSLENGNVVDIPESNDNIFLKIKRSFEDFMEYIKG